MIIILDFIYCVLFAICYVGAITLVTLTPIICIYKKKSVDTQIVSTDSNIINTKN